MSPTDIELLEGWASGDLAAGDVLFTRHFSAIHRFFRNKVGEAALEDLVQQTFARCVEGRDRFERKSSFRTFVFGIAHNLLREHIKRRKREGPVQWDEVSAADCGAGPSTVLVRRREQRVLLEALRQIPIESQVVLELYYWEEMPAVEVATVLGIPEGTVRGRVRRAKEVLRRQLRRLNLSTEILDSTIHDLETWAASLRDMLRAENRD